jgi:hypothetical protein
MVCLATASPDPQDPVMDAPSAPAQQVAPTDWTRRFAWATLGLGALHQADQFVRDNHSGFPFMSHFSPFSISLLVYPVLVGGLVLDAGPLYWTVASLLIQVAALVPHTLAEPPPAIYRSWTNATNLLGWRSPVTGRAAQTVQVSLHLAMAALTASAVRDGLRSGFTLRRRADVPAVASSFYGYPFPVERRWGCRGPGEKRVGARSAFGRSASRLHRRGEAANDTPVPRPEPARARKPLMLAGGLFLALALVAAPTPAPKLPPLEGPAASTADAERSPEVLASGLPELMEAFGASAASGPAGRRWMPAPGAHGVALRDAALQLRLSLAAPPVPTMHLSAHERVVLFPEQGPPTRRV